MRADDSVGAGATVGAGPLRPVRLALVYVGAPESASHQIMSPPIGVQLLATLARRAGHEAEVFDSRIDAGQVFARVESFEPTIVGFSFLSIAADEALRLAERCRGAGWLTIAGGIHASVFGAALLVDAGGAFDVVVTGEGENALLAVCCEMRSGERPSGVRAGAPVASLEDLPRLDDFAEYRTVLSDPSRTWRTAALQMIRGCPMNCQFCEVSRDAGLFEFPSNARRRSVPSALSDVASLVSRFDTNYLVIVDSIATLNDAHIGEFLCSVRDRWPTLSVQLNSHVHKVGPRFLGALQAFGADITVWIGFESGSQTMLDLIRKDTKAEHATEVALRILATGARLGVNLLLGLPGETDETRSATNRFAAALKDAQRYDDQVLLNPNIFHPLPGSPMFEPIVRAERRTQPSGPFGDYHVFSIEEIEAGGSPVAGIDYATVATQYRDLLALDGGRGMDGADYQPWVRTE